MSSDEDSSDEPPELIAAGGDLPVFAAGAPTDSQLKSGLYQSLLAAVFTKKMQI